MIVTTIVQLLTGTASIAEVVGDRIFPVQLPDATSFPAIVVTKVSGIGENDLTGDVGLEEARLQVDCYSADGNSAVIALKRDVRRAIVAFKGGTESAGPCAVQACFCINDFDSTDPATERAGPRLRRRTLEFRIWNTEV